MEVEDPNWNLLNSTSFASMVVKSKRLVGNLGTSTTYLHYDGV